ncbi:MAG: hypothetical protein SFY67_10145 [Candidatus Melainabacteria bacterium]|nr:hypothetical protein [Candidatus Melainabacteria bacterium]
MQFAKKSSTSFTKWALFLGVVYGAAAGCAPSEDDASITAGRPNPLNNTAPQPAATQSAAQSTLLSRIVVNPPQFKHPAVSPASIQAVKNAILALPEPLRTKLDATEARVIISPNMTDRWPESMKEQPEAEKDPAPTLAEQPGRIYGLDMCVYERPKKRGTTDLGPARRPEYIKLQVGDMLFQVLDDMMILSKDPELRKEWNEDKKHIPAEIAPKVGNFTKVDDWGPRETCAEMFGSMMGGRNENTDNLYKYFPRVKKWLIKRLGVTNPK